MKLKQTKDFVFQPFICLELFPFPEFTVSKSGMIMVTVIQVT